MTDSASFSVRNCVIVTISSKHIPHTTSILLLRDGDAVGFHYPERDAEIVLLI